MGTTIVQRKRLSVYSATWLGYVYCLPCGDKAEASGKPVEWRDVSHTNGSGRLELERSDTRCDGCGAPAIHWAKTEEPATAVVEYIEGPRIF